MVKNRISKSAVLSDMAQRGVFATAWRNDVQFTRKGWVVHGRAVMMPLDDELYPEPGQDFVWQVNIGWIPPFIKRHFGWHPKTEDIGIQLRGDFRHTEKFEKFEERIPDWMQLLIHKIKFYCVQI